MENENRLIKIDDLQIGDEVIVRGLDLNYMKIIRVPKKCQKTNPWTKNTYTSYTSSKCKRMNREKFDLQYNVDKEVYFDFTHKTIWLIKREK